MEQIIAHDQKGNEIHVKDQLMLSLPEHDRNAIALNGRHVTLALKNTVGLGTRNPTFRPRSKDPVVKEILGTSYIPFSWTRVVD